MKSSSVTANEEPNSVTRPLWSHWKKMPAWTLREAVALSLNISPKSVPKLYEKNPRKFKVFNARLKVAGRQLKGCFETVEIYNDNNVSENSTMVSPKSFVSFAMRFENWLKKLPPEFIEIGDVDGVNVSKTDIEKDAKSKEHAINNSKKPVKFIAALIKLLVEISYRQARKGHKVDVDKLPGIRSDLQKIANRFDRENLGGLTDSTFNTYIKGLCGFVGGSKSCDFYNDLFSDLAPTLGKFGKNKTDISSG